jgi:hypothetical protein
LTPAEVAEDPWAFGPWCFVVAEVRLLAEPIPCRGMQGWWPLQWLAGEAMESPPERRAAKALSALVPEINAYDWRALTQLQPYASAIAAGVKRIENRPQRRRIPEGGVWLGLHAGRSLYSVLGSAVSAADRAETARLTLEHWRTPEAAGRPAMWPDAPQLDELPMGVMLGAMRITQCLRYPDEGVQAELFGGARG